MKNLPNWRWLIDTGWHTQDDGSLKKVGLAEVDKTGPKFYYEWIDSDGKPWKTTDKDIDDLKHPSKPTKLLYGQVLAELMQYGDEYVFKLLGTTKNSIIEDCNESNN